MSHRIGAKIGEGGCAEVFEWENDRKIVKLAKSNTNLHAMEAELHHCRVAWEEGLSVPEPFELIYFEGRPGLVFERFYGQSIMERFVQKATSRELPQQEMKDVDYVDARITARLLHEIHGHSAPAMPSQRENIKHDIRRSLHLLPAEKEAVISLMERLPLKMQLCHGDPNPGNFLIRDDKAVVIDWTNASIGNPEADLAEYIVMIRYAILPPHLPNEAAVIFDTKREDIICEFMKEYETLSGIAYADIEPWMIPIAARKLAADGISDEEKHLLVNAIRRELR